MKLPGRHVGCCAECGERWYPALSECVLCPYCGSAVVRSFNSLGCAAILLGLAASAIGAVALVFDRSAAMAVSVAMMLAVTGLRLRGSTRGARSSEVPDRPIVHEGPRAARQTTPVEYDAVRLRLVDDLAHRRAVVFCGAGVSYSSGLPLAHDLLRTILEQLGVPVQLADIVLGSALPFEAFIEHLNLGRDIEEFSTVFELGRPCPAHRFLANLARAGKLHVVCTTNFDRLIEQAMDEVGLVRGRHFTVLATDEEIATFDWNDDRVVVVKIHGSVDAKKEMAITLSQVADKKLAEVRARVVRELFATGPHSTVFILGYSCSDIFDISPAIERLRGNLSKEIILIDHTTDLDDPSTGRVEPISMKVQKNPFKFHQRGARIYCDTDMMLRTLWESTLEDTYEAPQGTPASEWRNHLARWFVDRERVFSAAVQPFTAGCLFSELSEHRLAREFLALALKRAQIAGHTYAELNALLHLSYNALSLGQTKAAQKFANAALTLARRREDDSDIAHCFNALGQICLQCGDLQGAVGFFGDAVELLRGGDRAGDDGHEIQANLANAYRRLGRSSKARSVLEEMLASALQSGDKKQESSYLVSLANALGDINSRKDTYRRAIEIAVSIGDVDGEALSRLSYASACLDEAHTAGGGDDLNAASAAVDQAIAAASRSQSKRTHLGAIGLRGRLLLQTRRLREAELCFMHALELAKEIEDRASESRLLGNLGTVYAELGDLERGIGTTINGLRIAREVSERKTIETHLKNLHLLYRRSGDVAGMEQCERDFHELLRDIRECGLREELPI